MIETILLIVAMYAVLSLVGLGVLAPLDAETRSVLLPAAPIFGAGLIAAICSTTTRWLSVQKSLIIVTALLIVLVGLGLLMKRAPWRLERQAIIGLLLCPVLTLGGAAVASLPTSWVHDNRPVAATLIVDQFYYASTSTYLTHQPLLPAPYWNPSDWAGSATPSLGPVVDVIANRLRYGQASVASALSSALNKDPSDTVAPMSILLLVMMGAAVFVAATLLGVRRRWAFIAIPLVTSSLYVTTQSLEGKNDGLMGTSLGLMSLALSFAVSKNHRLMWPAVVTIAGLAATYSELVLVLVPPVVLGTLLNPRGRVLARLNMVAATWALAVAVTPWAWVWLAQSARIGGRFSQGSTPFDGRQGPRLLGAVLGAAPAASTGFVPRMFTLFAVVCCLAILGGIGWAIARTTSKGAGLGLVSALLLLECWAVTTHAGNLQYRAAQLCYPFILLIAVVGWDALIRNRSAKGRSQQARATSVTALIVVAIFSGSNVATAATHLPRDRAMVQHVPEAQLREAAAWVRKVGPSNVSVVVPRFTDLIWLSLELRADRGVGYPVVPAIYLGSFPRWDRQPDRYYVTGIGATLVGDVRVLQHNSRYQLVQLGTSGMIVTPFQPTYYWARPTYMRGFPCAREGAELLLLRGSRAPGTFDVASLAKTQVESNLNLDIDGSPVPETGPTVTNRGWKVQRYQVPLDVNSIMTVTLTAAAVDGGTKALPLLFGADLSRHLPDHDGQLTEFCSQDKNEGMDGYDQDLTTLRSR